MEYTASVSITPGYEPNSDAQSKYEPIEAFTTKHGTDRDIWQVHKGYPASNTLSK